MTKSRILTVVVTFYPEKVLLRKNVSAYVDYVDKVLVWENTPPEESRNYRYLDCEKLIYYGDGVNSISHALNYAWRYARDNGYDYLLTMDQDSVWEDFRLFLAKTVYSENAPVGIWTPQVIEREQKLEYVETLQPITSGMLIKTELLNNIGGWNELFTIDSVDDEFIIRAHRKGIKAYIIKGAKLNQTFGEPKEKCILGHTIKLRNYPPSRLYNIFRNNIILIRMYPEADFIKLNFKKSWLSYIKYILVFENQKAKKLQAIVKGMVAGKMYKIN